MTGLCLKYITYDPNYNYDNEEEDEDEMMETENGEDEEQGAGQLGLRWSLIKMDCLRHQFRKFFQTILFLSRIYISGLRRACKLYSHPCSKSMSEKSKKNMGR